jgi:hypothetical protein
VVVVCEQCADGGASTLRRRGVAANGIKIFLCNSHNNDWFGRETPVSQKVNLSNCPTRGARPSGRFNARYTRVARKSDVPRQLNDEAA